MMRYGYRRRHYLGQLASSGSLGLTDEEIDKKLAQQYGTSGGDTSSGGGFWSSFLKGAEEEAGKIARQEAEAGGQALACEINPYGKGCGPQHAITKKKKDEGFLGTGIPTMYVIVGGVVVFLLLRRKSSPVVISSNPRRRRRKNHRRRRNSRRRRR